MSERSARETHRLRAALATFNTITKLIESGYELDPVKLRQMQDAVREAAAVYLDALERLSVATKTDAQGG